MQKVARRKKKRRQDGSSHSVNWHSARSVSMRSHRIAGLLALAVGSMACGGADTREVADKSQPAFVLNGKRGLPNGIWREHTISVCWYNVPVKQFIQERQWVRQAVTATWQKHSGLTFVNWGFCKCGPLEHRNNAECRDNEMLSLTWTTGRARVPMIGDNLRNHVPGVFLWRSTTDGFGESEVKRVAVHEFGHAIGFTHEQNRPDTPDWCKDAPQGTRGNYTIGPWDAYSIMNYCRITQWDGTVEANWRLSAGDIAAVRQLYGPPTVAKAPQGIFGLGSTPYYSNGQDAVCKCPNIPTRCNHPQHCGKVPFPEWPPEWAPRYKKLPTAMENHGVCNNPC